MFERHRMGRHELFLCCCILVLKIPKLQVALGGRVEFQVTEVFCTRIVCEKILTLVAIFSLPDANNIESPDCTIWVKSV
jgi:hypothetical protein